MPAPTCSSTHYTILSLPSRTPPSGPQLKAAYRHALLAHHPDKSPSPSSPHKHQSPTIDQITLAYTTLSCPTLRKEYDSQLLTAVQPCADGKNAPPSHHPGFETVDLDDMAYTDATGEWYRGCRCGSERGYVVSEGDLEEAVGNGERKGEGEVVVGCAGCSLWVRVTFAVAEEW